MTDLLEVHLGNTRIGELILTAGDRAFFAFLFQPAARRVLTHLFGKTRRH